MGNSEPSDSHDQDFPPASPRSRAYLGRDIQTEVPHIARGICYPKDVCVCDILRNTEAKKGAPHFESAPVNRSMPRLSDRSEVLTELLS